MSKEPDRSRPNPALSQRFARQKRTATTPEVLLRRELFRRGLRYRVQFAVPGLPRKRVNLAFTRAQVAVLVDGCFWHACPEHCVVPKANRAWWEWKFQTNTSRDRATDEALRRLGWRVVRVWEHEDPSEAADRVEGVLRAV